MNLPSCSLVIQVARSDIKFMMHTIPHLVKMCNFNFLEKLLIVDAGNLKIEYTKRPGIGTLEDLRKCCNQLLDAGIVDKVIDIDFSDDYRCQTYTKHLNARVKETHNHRGAPVLGYIFSIEASQGDYVLYFDSDMLLYQKTGYSWIENGINLFEKHSDIAFLIPFSSPPGDSLPSNYAPNRCEHDPRGFYRFKGFTSRRFLVNRKRLDRLLPLPVTWLPARNKPRWMPDSLSIALGHITGQGGLQRWEIMISEALKRSDLYRVDLDSVDAWTIHPLKHDNDFVQLLPKIIEKVESGWYPPEQSEDYNLKSEVWAKALAEEK
jgi:hypothetical protein